MRVLLTLRVSGLDAGPYNFSSNINYSVIINPEPVFMPSGWEHEIEVPEGTTIVRVSSTGTCTNYVDVVLPITSTTSTSTNPPEACGITANAFEIEDPVVICASWNSYTPPSGAVYETYIQNIQVDFSSSLVFGEFVDDYLSIVELVSYSTMNIGTTFTFFPSNGEPSGYASSINPGTNVANDFNAGTDITMNQGYDNPNPVYEMRFVGTLVTNLRTRKFDYTSYYTSYQSEDEGPNGTGPNGIGAESSSNSCD